MTRNQNVVFNYGLVVAVVGGLSIAYPSVPLEKVALVLAGLALMFAAFVRLGEPLSE